MKELVSKWTTRSSTGIVSKGLYMDEEGRKYLIKGGSNYDTMEPLAECLGSALSALFIPSVKYTVEPSYKYPEIKTFLGDWVSVCEILPYEIKQFYFFCKLEQNVKYLSEEELVKSISLYGLDPQHLVKLLIVDALIGNSDRHWNNIDVHVEGDDVVGWAHALDFGRSMLFNIPEASLKTYSKEDIGPDESQPFGSYHELNLSKAFKALGITNKKILPQVGFQRVMRTLSNAYHELPDGACSEERYESLKSYIGERYEVYIEPYLRIGGRFIL